MAGGGWFSGRPVLGILGGERGARGRLSAGSVPTRRHSVLVAPPGAPAGLLLVALAAALAGCEPYVEGNGVLREEARDVPAFAGLSVEDGIQAFVAADADVRSVRVRGDENVLEFVETVVEALAPHGQVLKIRAASAYQSKNDLQVLVGAPVLRYLAAADASPASVSGAGADVFTVQATDGSNLTIAGSGGERLVVSLGGGQHGGARLAAGDYPVIAAEVTISAGASATLHATGSVEGTAAGAGSRVENTGAGTCEVVATDGAQVVCAAP